AASASSPVHGRNRRRLVISSSFSATTWTWAPSHIDYSSPTRLPVSTPASPNHTTKGPHSPRTVLSSLSGTQTVRPRQGYHRLVEGLFEPGGTTMSRPDSHADTTAAAAHSTRTDAGAATTGHEPEYEDSDYGRAHQWRDATRELVLAAATAIAAAHQPQSQG